MTNIWPLTGTGASSDWAFSGNTGYGFSSEVYLVGDGSFTGPSAFDILGLTGAADGDFSAAVIEGLSYTVTLYPDSSSGSTGDDAAIEISIANGDWTPITIPWVSQFWTDPAIAEVVAGAGGSLDGSFAVRGAGGGESDRIAFSDVSVELVGGGSPYSLSAASASFTVTGTPANLKQGHRLAASSASFILTGTAMVPKWGHKLTAASAAYTLTGTPTALKYARIFAVTPATFVLSGTAVGLKRGYSLSAGSASFTLTGTPLTPKWGHVLPCSSAAFVLSGTVTALRYARIFGVSAAAFTITGTPVNLKRGYRLQASSATYVLTGGSLEMIEGTPISLTAHPGRLGLGLTMGM